MINLQFPEVPIQTAELSLNKETVKDKFLKNINVV